MTLHKWAESSSWRRGSEGSPFCSGPLLNSAILCFSRNSSVFIPTGGAARQIAADKWSASGPRSPAGLPRRHLGRRPLKIEVRGISGLEQKQGVPGGFWSQRDAPFPSSHMRPGATGRPPRLFKAGRLAARPIDDKAQTHPEP